MSMRYKGGVISATPPTVTISSAPGLWTLEQQMQYQAAGTWPPVILPDPYFENVVALMHFDGTNGAQNNTFLDSSTNNFTITRNGNTTQGALSPFSRADGGWSNYFDGSGDYLSYASNAAFQFGTGDFTIEFWWNPSTLASTQTILYNTDNASVIGTGHYGVVYNTSLGLRLYINGGATTISQGATTGWAVGTWYHVAIVRNSNTVTIYRDGTSIASGSVTGVTIGAATTSYFGGEPLDPLYCTGYFSNLRIVKGTAVYTAAFTPPTTPLTAITNTSLLTCQSNRFKDNSTNAFTITPNGNVAVQAFGPFNPTTAYSTTTNGGSGYFDGSGDYLTVPDNAAFDFGTGDFTLETWVYITNAPDTTGQAIFGEINSGYEWYMYTRTSGNLEVGMQTFASGYSQIYTTNNYVKANQWAHVAVARQSGTLRFFVNGVQCTTTGSMPATLNNGSTINISRSTYNNANFIYGYLSDLRVVKGTAVYTANFTPPTAPLTAISGTSFLMNFTNAAAFDSAAIEDYETVGSSQLSTAQFKFGTSSLILNGTGSDQQNCLRSDDFSSNFVLGTGAFTVEGFLQLTSSSLDYPIIWQLKRADGQNVLTMFFGDAGFGRRTLFYVGSNSNLVDTGTSAGAQSVYLNTWKHFAVVRQANGTFTYYVDGTSVYSSSQTSDISSQNKLLFGAAGPSGTWGYLDEFRITKGVARYTSNFTPPTLAFPNL